MFCSQTCLPCTVFASESHGALVSVCLLLRGLCVSSVKTQNYFLDPNIIAAVSVKATIAWSVGLTSHLPVTSAYIITLSNMSRIRTDHWISSSLNILINTVFTISVSCFVICKTHMYGCCTNKMVL